MSILTLILALALIGLALWAINTYIPMPDWMKKTINIVAIVCVIIFLINLFSGGSLAAIRVPHF